MQKKGQLGIIEFRFFMMGFFSGLIGGFALVFLGTKNIIPFKIPFVCGSTLLMGKKGQLAGIESRDFIYGFLAGLVISLVLVFLGNINVLPFKIPLVCPVAVE